MSIDKPNFLVASNENNESKVKDDSMRSRSTSNLRNRDSNHQKEAPQKEDNNLSLFSGNKNSGGANIMRESPAFGNQPLERQSRPIPKSGSSDSVDEQTVFKKPKVI